jgi:hypothetical protein
MNISESNDLLLFKQNSSTCWLAPDPSGVAIALSPQPHVVRCAFARSTQEQDLFSAKSQLETDPCWWLLALSECPDGPPNRSAFLFIHRGTRNINWHDGHSLRMGKQAVLYSRATPETSIGSPSEGFGLFLTGHGEGSLWKIFRAEVDLLSRWVLTLSPVQISWRCPPADFSSLSAPLLADEVRGHYADLAAAIASNSYRAVVTDAKNIVEAIVADRLGNVEKSRDLGENLKAIKYLLEDGSRRATCGWTDLEYHIAQKIRLLHGQTHATSPTKTGRPLRPEFAGSAVEDLIELLRIWGYCRS